MALEYFPWYYSYRNKTAKLSDQELGRLVRALSRYGETGEREELAGRESIAFDFIADDIDRGKAAYAAKCDQNRHNRQQSTQEYGRSATTDNDRPRSSTTDDDRPRPSTTVHKTKYKDKDKEKEKNKDKNAYGVTAPAHAREGGGVVDCVLSDFLARVNPDASPRCLEELGGYAEQLGEGVCKRAFDIAIDNKKPTWGYIRGILRRLQTQGVRCLDDWDAAEQNREEPKAGYVYDYGNTEGSL